MSLGEETFFVIHRGNLGPSLAGELGPDAADAASRYQELFGLVGRAAVATTAPDSPEVRLRKAAERADRVQPLIPESGAPQHLIETVTPGLKQVQFAGSIATGPQLVNQQEHI